MFGGAANPDPQHSRRAPARAHLRQHLDHPVHDVVAGVHHLELRLVLAPAAFGRDVDRNGVSRHHGDVEHARGIVAGVAAGEGRIGQDRGAQLVFRVEIGPAHPFIDHVLQRQLRFEPALLAPFDEDIDDAGVLTDRAVPFGAHPAVGQDLGDCIFGCRTLFGFIGIAQRADIVHRVEVADELQGIGHTFDQVFLADRHHVHALPHRFGVGPCRPIGPQMPCRQSTWRLAAVPLRSEGIALLYCLCNTACQRPP